MTDFADMTAIKHTLQREVFLPCEERLVGVVHVTKVGKKKKASFLCAAGQTSPPPPEFRVQLSPLESRINSMCICNEEQIILESDRWRCDAHRVRTLYIGLEKNKSVSDLFFSLWVGR